VQSLYSTSFEVREGFTLHVVPGAGSCSVIAAISVFISRYSGRLDIRSSRWDGTLLQAVVCRGDFPSLAVSNRFLCPSAVTLGSSSSRLPLHRYPLGHGSTFVEYPAVLGRFVGKVVCLAGSLEEQSGPGWRKSLCGSMSVESVSYLSPRVLGSVGRGGTGLVRQDWERYAVGLADVVWFFRFLSGTTSSVSLLELGTLCWSGRVVVCCEPGYLRAGPVEGDPVGGPVSGARGRGLARVGSGRSSSGSSSGSSSSPDFLLGVRRKVDLRSSFVPCPGAVHIRVTFNPGVQTPSGVQRCSLTSPGLPFDTSLRPVSFVVPGEVELGLVSLAAYASVWDPAASGWVKPPFWVVVSGGSVVSLRLGRNVTFLWLSVAVGVVPSV